MNSAAGKSFENYESQIILETCFGDANQVVIFFVDGADPIWQRNNRSPIINTRLCRVAPQNLGRCFNPHNESPLFVQTARTNGNAKQIQIRLIDLPVGRI